MTMSKIKYKITTHTRKLRLEKARQLCREIDEDVREGRYVRGVHVQVEYL